MVKRKHKTIQEARAEIAKANNGFNHYKVFKVKGAKVWKYKVATELEWLHGLV